LAFGAAHGRWSPPFSSPLGVVMLMQPFALGLYTYSFIVTLLGTVMFIIVSHFRE
jgi:hypothetical protein